MSEDPRTPEQQVIDALHLTPEEQDWIQHHRFTRMPPKGEAMPNNPLEKLTTEELLRMQGTTDWDELPLREEIRRRLEDADQDKRRFLDTIRAIAVDGLGLSDPAADNSPEDPPADWQGLLSEKVKAMRERLEECEAAGGQMTDRADEIARETFAKCYPNGDLIPAIAAALRDFAKEERERVKAWLDEQLATVKRSGNLDYRSLELVRNQFVREFLSARIREGGEE